MLSSPAVHEGETKSPPKHTVVAEALPAVMATPPARTKAIKIFAKPLRMDFSYDKHAAQGTTE